jgi:phosphoenolpyruvate carboxylase
MERMGHENRILRQGMLGSTKKDLELQVVYRYLSEAEHGMNFARQQLDLTHEEVSTRTDTIIHLENVVETQDLELQERAEMIATIEQQLLYLQLQAPRAPEDTDEADAMSSIDED